MGFPLINTPGVLPSLPQVIAGAPGTQGDAEVMPSAEVTVQSGSPIAGATEGAQADAGASRGSAFHVTHWTPTSLRAYHDLYDAIVRGVSDTQRLSDAEAMVYGPGGILRVTYGWTSGAAKSAVTWLRITGVMTRMTIAEVAAQRAGLAGESQESLQEKIPAPAIGKAWFRFRIAEDVPPRPQNPEAKAKPPQASERPTEAQVSGADSELALSPEAAAILDEFRQKAKKVAYVVHEVFVGLRKFREAQNVELRARAKLIREQLGDVLTEEERQELDQLVGQLIGGTARGASRSDLDVSPSASQGTLRERKAP
ncbi:MAG: hypothetical protein Q8R13_01425 [bacterium]|nr:hypothetical protein [bacterium]